MNKRLLGITIDNRLRLKQHITDLCKTAHGKLSALIRHSNILNFEKEKHFSNLLLNLNLHTVP